MEHKKPHVHAFIKAEVKPPAPSITKEEHDRIVAAAVHSEHAAGSDERKKAVADAVAATREVCEQECIERLHAESNACAEDQLHAVEAAIAATRESCGQGLELYVQAENESCARIADKRWLGGGIAEEIRKRAKKR